MSVITFTSDFGLVDYKVAAVKGRILFEENEAKIVDISHEIEAHNLLQSAYVLKNAYQFFPRGSVHIVAVDCLYTKSVKNIVYKADGHYFIASDNGVLSLIFSDIKPEKVYEITLNKFENEILSTVIDIFVPVAVHLLRGGVPEVIGRVLENPKELTAQRAVFSKTNDMINGHILYIDNYGNLVSNISKDFFKKAMAGYESFTVKFRNYTLSKIYNHYTEFIQDWDKENEYHGKSVAVFNEADLLEIFIYKGNKNNGAKNLFGLKVGESVYIEFK